MNLGIIGCGAIGTDVALAADKMKAVKKIYLFDKNIDAVKKLHKLIEKSEIKKVEDFLDDVNVVYEAASQKAVIEYGSKVLSAKKDLVIMSIGSLFDNKLRNDFKKLAVKNNCKIYLPSGAVCGIDGLYAANVDEIDEVTLVTTKPPNSLGKQYDKRTVIFRGTAREAVKQFPANINVAGCLSLAGNGFDKTRVEIVADPVTNRINHKILAHGRFGRLRAEMENMPNPKNPKSSYMASLSAIAVLRKIIEPIQIGI